MADEIRFDDGASYELMMGRWSRLVGERFLEWINVPDGARWIDVGVALAPILPGLAVVVLGIHLAAPNAKLSQWAPIVGLFCLWLVGFWFLARRQRLVLQAQIDELDRLRDG